jgi:hypothetical protein
MEQTLILHYVHCGCVHSKRGLRETAALPYIGCRNRSEVSLLNKWQRYSFHNSSLFCPCFVITRNEKKWENLLEKLFAFCYCVYCCLVLLINSAIVFGIVVCTFGCSDLATTGYQQQLQSLWLRL